MKSVNLEISMNVLNKNIKRDIMRGYSHSVERETEKLNRLVNLKSIISNIEFDQDIENMIDMYARDVLRGYDHSAEQTLGKITKMVEMANLTSTHHVPVDKGIKIMVDGKEISINQLVAGLANNPATKNASMEISMVAMTGKLESVIDSIRAEM